MTTDVLVVAEHLRGRLCGITREVVSAGAEIKKQCGGRLLLAVIARDPGSLVEAASLAGVDETVGVPVAEDEFNADVHTQAIEALVQARRPAVILVGFTANGMALGPVLATHLGLGFAGDVIECSMRGGEIVARRQFYGGKVEAELEFPGAEAVVLLLRPTVWAPAAPEAPSEVTLFRAAIDPARVRIRHRALVDPPSDDVDISRAEFVLAIGRGIGERENVPRFQELAKRLGATLAGSRPLIDAGWLPQSRQVGQSGVTVKPKLYLALGISGAAQHLAGMKASETIVAINKDANAPIFGVAHFGAVADLFDVVDELEGLSSSERGS
jgi:electron transfer flavoprotein alpha subunit